MENTNQNMVQTGASSLSTEMQTKLANGFTPLENLKLCIHEGNAVATTFEVAIADEGLTMEMISLIKNYYTDEDYPESVEEYN